MSVAPVSNGAPVQELKILIPKDTETKSNVQEEKDSNLAEPNWCLCVKRYAFLLVTFNFLVFSCLAAILVGHLIAWEDPLRNLTNSTTIPQYKPIKQSMDKCLIITNLIVLIFMGSIVCMDRTMKNFRQTHWTKWIGIVFLVTTCLAIVVAIIIFLINLIPKERFEIFLTNIFKNLVFNKDINGNLIINLPEKGALPLQISYAFYCFLCVTILCNIQNIILTILIIKIKPKNVCKSTAPTISITQL